MAEGEALHNPECRRKCDAWRDGWKMLRMNIVTFFLSSRLDEHGAVHRDCFYVALATTFNNVFIKLLGTDGESERQRLMSLKGPAAFMRAAVRPSSLPLLA